MRSDAGDVSAPSNAAIDNLSPPASPRSATSRPTPTAYRPMLTPIRAVSFGEVLRDGSAAALPQNPPRRRRATQLGIRWSLPASRRTRRTRSKPDGYRRLPRGGEEASAAAHDAPGGDRRTKNHFSRVTPARSARCGTTWRLGRRASRASTARRSSSLTRWACSSTAPCLAHVNYCDDADLDLLSKGIPPSSTARARTLTSAIRPTAFATCSLAGSTSSSAPTAPRSSPISNLVEDLRLHSPDRTEPQPARRSGQWSLAVRDRPAVDARGRLPRSRDFSADVVVFEAHSDDPLREILEILAKPSRPSGSAAQIVCPASPRRDR